MSTQLITIKNNKIKVEISSLGAEIQSIIKDGKEYLWNGDPQVWSGRAPVMFPICGGLKEDKYIYKEKEYILEKHGYAKTSEFEVENATDDSAVFLLKSNDGSKKMYPFDYEFRVCYTLTADAVNVEYKVTNTSDDEMYFSFGCHEAYFCPEGIEEYSLVFEKEERLTTNELHGNLMSEKYNVLGENIKELPLKYDYFKIDALTFLNLKSKSITLKHKDGNRQVRIDYDGFPYMFVWTMAGKYGKYICIEPWCGIPDFEGTSYDFTQKIGINKLDGRKSFSRIHTITFEK